MSSVAVTLRFRKETKNTIAFEEVAAENGPVIGTVYISKDAIEALDQPQAVTVTIEPANLAKVLKAAVIRA
jgi:hypothetical protein